MAATATPRVLMLEFNELCPTLIDRWIGEGRLPNFARLRDASDVFTTIADVEEPALLEPWIQWYSIHTGLAYDQHGVFHLTDGPDAGYADIYSTLIEAGRTVGSFSSMNVAPFAAPGSFYVGDPWSERGDASPAELNVFNRFVAAQVREHSNASAGTGIGEGARFLAFMLRHGLSAATVTTVLRQLAAEKVSDPRVAYRRVAILDRLQADVFGALYGRYRPDFASFFLNSTAHLQHSYWRHLEPHAFEVKPDAAELALYGDAVRFGYEAMDRLIGGFLALAKRHDARIVFATALSQQPFVRYEAQGGQHFHRLHDVSAFLDRMGIARLSVAPTMTHQYMIHFADIAARDAARARLEALRVEGGRRLFDCGEPQPEPQLYVGCQIATRTDEDAVVIDDATGDRLRFGDLLYRIDAIKSGCHHPEGALWITGGGGRRHAGTVSVLDVFPTLLDLLGVDVVPPGLARRGTSLAAGLGARHARAA